MAPNDNNKYWIPLPCQCSFFTGFKKEPRHGPVFRYLVWIMVGNSPTTRTIPPPNHRNTRFSFNGSELVVCGVAPRTTPPVQPDHCLFLLPHHTWAIPSPVLPCLPALRDRIRSDTVCLPAMAFVRPPDDEERGVDDRTPLLDDPVKSQDEAPVRIARRLYVSHFLSTWNSRVFEFGAVLYLAKVFPGTLLPMSVYALTRGVSAITFASAVGQYVDTGNRLQVVRVSIGKPVFCTLFACCH